MVLGSLYARVYAEAYAKVILRYNIMTKNYPIDINFETTTACNLKCKYCPRYELIRKGVRDAGHMDYDLVNKIIRDMSKISDKRFSICPVGLGEPLLYPQIYDVLKLLRERFPRARIHINTNAVLLDEESSKELIKTGIDDIIFSINIWDEELYERYHGVDALPDVIENVRRFLQMKGDRKPRAVLQILDIDINKERIGAFMRYWKPYLNENDVIYVRPICDYGGRISLNDFISQQKDKKRYPCQALFTTVMINKDGFIFPCCMGVAYPPDVDICLGNVQNINFIEAFRGEVARNLRKLHKTEKYDSIYPCNVCGSWKVMKNIFFKVGGRWI
jgi:MoaA/NifB/PqqE/SkfB family radical SAM enzyme